MLVMKFGGTSVADADRIRHVARLIVSERGPVVVVTSALGGVTDELLKLGECARGGDRRRAGTTLDALRTRHEEAAEAIASSEPVRASLRAGMSTLFDEMTPLLQGIELLRECSGRSADLLVSFGERLAAPLVAAAVEAAGKPATAVDARQLLVTVDGPDGSVVDQAESRRRTREILRPLANDRVPVVTGFIAASSDGATTTLGRGGSDYTATLLGAFLDAEAIWIWTDVEGVMTADPRVVQEARVLPAVSYREAAEMAYFGSKVLHPSAMIPAVREHIPVLIRSTFHPEHPGTRISELTGASALGVKTVTSVPDLAMITVEGNGMIGVPGVMKRIFTVTADERANVYMVSQASSEHNISFLVKESDGQRVVRGLEEEFAAERQRGQIDRVDLAAPVGIVAAIGEGMRGTPGIAQRMFTALGRGRINVLAIAQGSSELNLSAVVRRDDLSRAVGAVHSRFGLTRDTHVLLWGKGQVGRALLRQAVAARRRLADQHGIGLKVIGVCGRTDLLLDLQGIDDDRLLQIADGAMLQTLGGEPRPLDEPILERIARSRWLDVVAVDVTAEDTSSRHLQALRHGFHVVTANKKPMTGPLSVHREIAEEAARHGVSYLFETTFGAGLPALHALQELLATRDEIHRITGCFSGTLGFICTALQSGQRLSEAVEEARRRGYTEPDPREDLSGIDVARKALIIARELGAELEMTDIDRAELVPTAALESGDDPASLCTALAAFDEPMQERIARAATEGRVPRYVAEITSDRVSVGLRDVDTGSAVGQLSGPDNILVFHTERYHEHPLIIRGPGAGADVTAAGVLGDILKIVRAT
ncbi:MAG: bifunctional aspartate kinase/homoserine dehydrogenase I [Planctomycetota bacterium]|jgi:aspartokinase/homoserine dehydrogenase 1